MGQTGELWCVHKHFLYVSPFYHTRPNFELIRDVIGTKQVSWGKNKKMWSTRFNQNDIRWAQSSIQVYCVQVSSTNCLTHDCSPEKCFPLTFCHFGVSNFDLRDGIWSNLIVNQNMMFNTKCYTLRQPVFRKEKFQSYLAIQVDVNHMTPGMMPGLIIGIVEDHNQYLMLHTEYLHSGHWGFWGKEETFLHKLNKIFDPLAWLILIQATLKQIQTEWRTSYSGYLHNAAPDHDDPFMNEGYLCKNSLKHAQLFRMSRSDEKMTDKRRSKKNGYNSTTISAASWM